MSYPAYLISSSGLPRDHHSIFIETSLHGPHTGHLYQVTRNIQTRMIHAHCASLIPPEEAPDFGGMKKFLGIVRIEDYEKLRKIVDKVEAPKKQFDGARKIEPEVPLRRFQEWAREAMRALREKGVLECSGHKDEEY
ncbi:hypothetical protein BCON_0158g00240 [Botryotinia convoluta]|uniref:Uncharacterized protein n=1 Tax=Botryotinia convoluta TaxID=54673 RepID=A0A4Z1HRD1_9HELO|nr:hypothetical protein BCON_0158g00240 [Botryotinia convoluta]